MFEYFNQGWSAYYAEQTIEDNPYALLSIEGQEWDNGFMSAEADYFAQGFYNGES